MIGDIAAMECVSKGLDFTAEKIYFKDFLR
jgi:hypothetical protein